MKISEFDYDLPESNIAKYPPPMRGHSRLLVLDRTTGKINHHNYSDLPELLGPGDVLVLNDTKVIRARLTVERANGRLTELLLLERHLVNNLKENEFLALRHGGIKSGETVRAHGQIIQIISDEDQGILKIQCEKNLYDLADAIGLVPLPPYLKRTANPEDILRYQTVFAKERGSVAAPTATLNMTSEILNQLEARGVRIAYLTLHVGLGTFLPVRAENIEEHKIHKESYCLPQETIRLIREAKSTSQKIIAGGTTVARALEHAAAKILDNGKKTDLIGEADILIYPGYKFQIVDNLLTNFHAPRSTVLLLAAAFAGPQNLRRAYQEALKNNYKFLSYGDSMLIR